MTWRRTLGVLTQQAFSKGTGGTASTERVHHALPFNILHQRSSDPWISQAPSFCKGNYLGGSLVGTNRIGLLSGHVCSSHEKGDQLCRLFYSSCCSMIGESEDARDLDKHTQASKSISGEVDALQVSQGHPLRDSSCSSISRAVLCSSADYIWRGVR